MERLLNMILRRLVNKGVNFGIKTVSNRGGKNCDESKESRQMAQQRQKNARGLRRTSKLLRRFGKF